MKQMMDSMKIKQFLRKAIRIVLPLALGCILFWYLYQDQDLDEMMQIIKTGVRYDVILFSLIFGLGANVVRGFRWGLLIDSFGERVGRRNIILAVLGNYAINMALPRLGEVWRCGVTAKYEKTPFTKLLGTLLVDRLMDMLVVTLIMLCVCVFNIPFFNRFLSEHPDLVQGVYALFTSVWVYVVLASMALLTWLLFTRWGHLSFIQKGKGALLNIWEGVRSLWKMNHKLLFVLQTLLIWGGYFLYFYVTFYAFDFTRDLGLRIGLIVFAMSSISVAVPIQGGIGVWHFIVIATLLGFGVSEKDAAAYALVVYTIQSVWTVATGLFAIVALPVVNRGITRK